MGQWLEEVYPQPGPADGLRAAGEVAVRGVQQGQEHRRPRLVQRADGRLAAHSSDRRLRRQDRGPAIAHRGRAAVQLGPRAQARVRPRDQLAADRLQHSALVHRGAGRAERGLSAAAVVERRCWSAHVAANKLFNLDTINLGFIRPHSSDEWTLAYCQAELYAEYMLERFGDDAIAKMLAAYADNLTTPEALARSFDVPQADFEDGYRAVRRQDRGRIARPRPQARNGAGGRAEGAGQEPARSRSCWPDMAQAQLGRKNYAEARRSADAALADRTANGAGPLRPGPAAPAGGRERARPWRGSKARWIATIRRRICWPCWPA